MLSIRTESVISWSRSSNPSFLGWVYLNIEILLGLGLSGFLVFLGIVKSFLPKPPRDLTGNIVLVTGATTSLGRCLAEEFASSGCSVYLVDGPGSNVEELAEQLREKHRGARRLEPAHRKEERRVSSSPALGYVCDLSDREKVRVLGKKLGRALGGLDVLVTCTPGPIETESFHVLSRALAFHYWTVLAFLPSMLHRERAHVIGITPTKCTMDASIGSRAAVAGLMDSLAQQFNGQNNTLTFMTVAPNAEPSLMKQSEQVIARKVVQAVQRNQSCLSINWSSKLLYFLSCRLYSGITTISRWFDT
ncbi:PREDICTED: epidermal retinol dehydrogenase 2-like [Ceratosolen solmsi marchali]|uniref:Epidermal retinol dehydrogenase 2-like n=1 Tax=Ceratosolen solmsi marchali TaxID=326594 RepID=A0AAJ6VNR0_9HYME|nr:PREDICTED: epidermal retinol dehydrogenase 2-like [Ceratosolen solmsi marchali]